MRRHKFSSRRRFEILEARQMMAGDITFSNGVVTITGSGNDDVAEVRFDENELSVDLDAGSDDDDEHEREFNIANVSRIIFNGFAGDDQLTVEVDELDSNVTLNHITLEFHGGEDDDELLSNLQDGVKTVAFGDGGNDTLMGSQFGDIFEGGAGDDDLSGGRGNDKYVFGGTTSLGIDFIRNEASNVDTDTLDLSNLGEGAVTMLHNVVDPAFPNERYAAFSWSFLMRVEIDNATGLENVIGTAYEDHLGGNSRNNHLFGGGSGDTIAGFGGNDTLEGGAGNDTYHFGEGNLGTDNIIEAANADADTLDFSNFGQGVTVDISRGVTMYAVNMPNLRLRLSNSTAIEDVFGSMYNDTITGNGRNNYLKGRDGNDTITGAGGADSLHGGGHDDTFYSDALDLVYGDSGRDWFDRYREPATPGAANPLPARYRDWGRII